jgi:RND family efflux transporter MFP subunit
MNDALSLARSGRPHDSAILLALLALWLLPALVGCEASPEPEAPSRSEALPVETVRVEAADHYVVGSRHVGQILARRQAELGFTRSDRLVSVLVDEGDRVEQGEVLARLDTSLLEAQRKEWLAQRREVKARLDLARLTLDRRKELAGKDSISTQRYDEARYEVMALEARLASIAAGLDRVEIDIAQSSLEAPFAGSIIRRVADEGAIPAPGAPVVTLIESGAMEVRVGVPPALAARLRVGDRHPIEIDGAEVEAAIGAIRQDVRADTRTVTVVLPIEADHAPAARHGALARLRIEERREARGFWLPITALTESRRGLWGAFVLAPGDASDEFVLDRQELMMIHAESDRAFVRGTLVDGDEVVVTGLQRIAPGQHVRRAETRSARR